MTQDTFKALGISADEIARGDLIVRSPVDGAVLGHVRSDTAAEVDAKIAASVIRPTISIWSAPGQCMILNNAPKITTDAP